MFKLEKISYIDYINKLTTTNGIEVVLWTILATITITSKSTLDGNIAVWTLIISAGSLVGSYFAFHNKLTYKTAQLVQLSILQTIICAYILFISNEDMHSLAISAFIMNTSFALLSPIEREKRRHIETIMSTRYNERLRKIRSKIMMYYSSAGILGGIIATMAFKVCEVSVDNLSLVASVLLLGTTAYQLLLTSRL